MENFTNEQMEKVIAFYKQLGISADKFFVDGKIKSIFEILQIKPDVGEDGERRLTPYEILGLMPNIQNGEEKPIIFFLKNKLRGLKLTKIANLGSFLFSKEKNQDEKDKSLIQFILSNYKTAIVQNNLSEAERQFDMLNKITGGRAKHYIGSFYDYTKFYKQMKKQLLIDLFSHFFLIYLMEKKSLIKKGLIIKNKKFKAFNANKNVLASQDAVAPQIKSIRIDEVAEVESQQTTEKISDVGFDKSMSKAEIALSQDVENEQKVQPEQVAATNKQSFIKRLRSRLLKRNKLKQKLLGQMEMIDSQQIDISKMEEKEVSYE